MKTISKSRFRTWLEKFNPSETFCTEDQCPLEEYGGEVAAYADHMGATPWRFRYMALVDGEVDMTADSWRKLTAGEALEALAKVA